MRSFRGARRCSSVLASTLLMLWLWRRGGMWTCTGRSTLSGRVAPLRRRSGSLAELQVLEDDIRYLDDWIAGGIHALEGLLARYAAFEDFYTNRRGDAA